MKKIAILGSTGSIGCNTLKIIRHLRDQFEVTALAVKDNIDLLEQQILEFHPSIVAVYNSNKACELQKRVPHCTVLAGKEGLRSVASLPATEMVISAIAGTLGLEPTVAAIQAGKDIGLANKEVLVSGGALIMRLVHEHGVNLIPIDSEHSAIFQCLQGQSQKAIQRIILTSSGGPFRYFTNEQLEHITTDQALNHPTWRMGPKVTIDSSTLMNKGLEVIEAYWLFGVHIEQIQVVIHPQSIIHSLVEFIDGSILAQMGEPTMLTPIQYALTYPERYPGLLKPFDFLQHNVLQFSIPDVAKFRCLDLAYEALRQGGTLPCYMNAANEILVQRFLKREISWKQIAQQLESLMMRHKVESVDRLETILMTDTIAREEASYF
jgi:1-deoxy-D-xylulose-5-phosphate reductoisomerase